MSNKSTFTRNEHYIPKEYLRGFSIEDGKRVYAFDMSEGKSLNNPVSINSICYEIDQYEFKNENGDYVLHNRLEKILGKFESRFKLYKSKIEKKVLSLCNYNKPCFLTSEEKIFWITYITIQMLRLPDMINTIENFSKENFKGYSEIQHHNIAISGCLPFYKDIEPGSVDAYILEFIFDSIKDLRFMIGVDDKNRIITSDRVFFKNGTFDDRGLVVNHIYFPLNKSICMILYREALVPDDNRKSFAYKLNDVMVQDIIQGIASSSNRWLYSSYFINKDVLKWINQINIKK